MMTDPDQLQPDAASPNDEPATDTPGEQSDDRPAAESAEEALAEGIEPLEDVEPDKEAPPEETPSIDESPDDEQTTLTPEFCRRVEAILFTSEQPISAHRIASVLKVRDGLVKAAIRDLGAQYDLEKHAFGVVEIAGGFQVLTRPEYGPLIAKLYEQSRQSRLSQAALETLAIVAYKQPVMRVEVEDIRGVGVQPVLRNLLDMGLVRVVGRAEALGRPLLYGTTQKFLITFGLKSPRDLPSIEDLKTTE